MQLFMYYFYILLIIILFLLSVQYWFLIFLCPKRVPENFVPSDETYSRDDLPKVTVQIPVFNERYMVRRIINSVAKLDYPLELLQIQVLDDSTDDTLEIAREEVDKISAQGINIELIHRSHRTGFKAGALAEGLKTAHGEFIAIFDADFVPHSNFLKRLIVDRRGFDEPDVGYLQTRWVFLNREMSLLTQAQGYVMDPHFFIDQQARFHAGLHFTFNGSGGIWRKTCIEDAGGWHFDTLTEDLDLSLRAKMKDWRGIYYIEEESPNDLPADILAFKQQQKRWARGNAQCLRKLMFTIFASKFTLFQKLSSLFQMSGYFVCIFLITFIMFYPWLALDSELMFKIPKWVHAVGTFCMSYFVAVIVGNIKRGGDIKQFFRKFFFTVLIMMGISFNNTVAVMLGLFRRQVGVFERTPKEELVSMSPEAYNNPLKSDKTRYSPKTSNYRLKPDWTLWVELGLSIYSFTMAVLVVKNSYWYFSLPMVVYGTAFLMFSYIQLNDVIRSRDPIDIPPRDTIRNISTKETTL